MSFLGALGFQGATPGDTLGYVGIHFGYIAESFLGALGDTLGYVGIHLGYIAESFLGALGLQPTPPGIHWDTFWIRCVESFLGAFGFQGATPGDTLGYVGIHSGYIVESFFGSP